MGEPCSVQITLPLPPKALSPNARGHWSKKYKATRAYRLEACLMTRLLIGEQFNWEEPKWERATVKATFYFKYPRRHADSDNLLASLKSGFDGIVDAGLLADDKNLRHEPVEIDKQGDKFNPRVEIEIVRGD